MIWLKWRLLVEDGRKACPRAARSADPWAGHTYSQPDLIIAANALYHGLTVVSRDTGDFAKARIPVLNPWHDTNAT